jgi:hypothetical protein
MDPFFQKEGTFEISAYKVFLSPKIATKTYQNSYPNGHLEQSDQHAHRTKAHDLI